MAYSYDPSNIFARILRGEIPARTVLETEHALAFHDINPSAPHHVLVIPRGAYVNLDDFSLNASDAEIVGFQRAVGRLCAELGVAPDGGGEGYRAITNSGPHGMQEVPHYHVHILAGRVLGRLVEKP
jgi:histidine triad (HIT) family protein